MRPIMATAEFRNFGPTRLAIAILLVGYQFVLYGHVRPELSDEGYFYYGVLRVCDGEIPIADFQSYDIFRYYWAAAWTCGLGGNLFAVRAATALLGVATIWVAIGCVRKVTQDKLVLLILSL